MTRAKKAKAITGIGSHPERSLVVQKCNPMTVLARSELSLAELKILDMYLSRIDTHNPEQRTVKLTKGQLEQALGVTQIKKADLKQRLKNLYQPIDLAKDDKKRLHLISLFEEAEAEQDDDGVWQITLTCTQSAMKYMFCLEDYGYFKYTLSSIVSLKSRYSLIMFLYLEKNRYRTPWVETLDVLKHELNCDADELYKEFKMFNQRILKNCQKELHEKTECRFTYEPIKKGRTVVAIRFEVETLPKLEFEIPEAPALEAEDPSRPIWERALGDWKLSEEQLDELAALLVMVPAHKLPSCQKEDLERARYQYIAQKAAEIKRRNEEKRIRSRFAYLRKLLQEDISSKPPQETPQPEQPASSGTQAFKNFTERKNNNYTEKIMAKYRKA